MADRSGAPEYRGATFALLTQHGKERVIAPLFTEALGAEVRRVHGYDTDQLGTFTRDVQRPGDQLETARRKAVLGAELSGRPLALASEGAFRPGPFGLYLLNLELVVLVDRERSREIVGRSEAITRGVMTTVASEDELERVAEKAGFPGHALVVRPNDGEDRPIRKGLASRAALLEAYAEVRALSPTKLVLVESDLRAHMNPTRMENIGRATADLLRRILTPCPGCGAPGFGLVRSLSGLPCADCGAPTRSKRAEEHGCIACEHLEVRAIEERSADPMHCDACNP